MDFLDWQTWAEYQPLGNPLMAWLAALGVFIVVWIALGIVRRIVRKRVAQVATPAATIRPPAMTTRASMSP